MALVKIRGVLDGCHEDEKVAIRGWVYRKRKGKKLIFLLVRDSTGFIQCTIKKNSPAWNEAERLTIESSLTIEGTAIPDERAPGGHEIAAESISIIGLAELFPITKDQSEQFIRDVRHLWLRSRRMNLIMKLRASVLEFARDFFKSKDFT
ncbi:MAG: OB-fold nucleic acid binding domain-containing protein, partial [Candidatus Bathyarchaeia archaeon]|nr:OB-fold nucleic acid binding domain-containing protein [Candidatus Bathyarchaeia archaeon]